MSATMEVARAGAWRGRLRNRPPLSVCVAGMVLVIAGVAVVLPGVLDGHDPSALSLTQTLQGSSSAHPLGTDALGRDILTRVVHGARTGLLAPLVMATVTLAISVVLALVSGFYGGWVDAGISRVVEVLYSLPNLIVAIVVVGVFGGGLVVAILVLTLLGLPANVWVLRSAVLERRRLAYIESAETMGVRPLGIMVRHLLPTLAPLIAACGFIRFTYGIVDLSALSFLGLGTPPGSTDWGRMLAENRTLVFQNSWASLAPGLALVLAAVSTNLVGDFLYERFQERGER
jgi:ABC-type dipeptide/oligopeptide/nickel transport system permease subunit